MEFREGSRVILQIPDSRRNAPFYKYNGVVTTITEMCGTGFAILSKVDNGLWPIQWLLPYVEEEEDEENIEPSDMNFLIGGIYEI